MHRLARRAVLRASALGLLATAAIVAACSDGSSSDMEFKPGGTTYPEEEAGNGATSSSGGSSSGEIVEPGDDDDGADASHPSTDGGDAGTDGGDAGSDADAGDAGSDAGDAGVDAGNDPTLGSAPDTITFAGLGLGIGTQDLVSSNFAGNDLNAWQSAALRFDHGTTTVTGAGAALGEIAWGFWTGGTVSVGGGSVTWPANGGAIYVVGHGNTTGLPAQLQRSATLVGATPSIMAGGGAAPGTATGSIATNQTGIVSSVGFNATVTLGADSYSLLSNGGSLTPSTSELVADGTGKFSHTYQVASASAYCGGSCNASVQGFIGGPNGDVVALVIHIYKSASGEAGSVSAGLAFTVP